ncbi:hypothetical protein PspS35_27420 [Pseudomonas sp. S35]|nr:hypothetical protein PspS35_27420 [Pseudomonas sp. S35]
MECVVAVKQVFETYVYDLGMSSAGQMPFVMTCINPGATRPEARCHIKESVERVQDKTGQIWEGACPLPHLDQA